MSSLPLISHHLFVAAVKDKNCDGQDAAPVEPALDPVHARAKEVQVELVEDGRPSPLEREFPADMLFWTGPN